MAPRPSKPVLLIDDNEDIRVSMSTLLDLDGYSVVSAAEGEEALTKLREGLEPCVILLDMLMPRKDGLQFRAEQLADPRFATIPTIASSASSGLESKLVPGSPPSCRPIQLLLGSAPVFSRLRGP